MKNKWDSIKELEALNKAAAIFEQHSIDPRLFPELVKDGIEYSIFYKEDVNEIIREMVEVFRKEHPLWNFGKFPHERNGD